MPAVFWEKITPRPLNLRTRKENKGGDYPDKNGELQI